MDLAEIREKIQTSDDFVFSEIKKLQRLMELKQEIRFDLERSDELHTESVADHVYGMHVLVEYFLPLEDSSNSWDREKINAMVQWHDIDEIETGDVMGYLKTEEDRIREHEAQKKVLEEMPSVMVKNVQLALEEYEERTTIESRFVKGIDKMEAALHVFSETGKKIIAEKKTTFAQNQKIKAPFVQDFPCMKRFQSLMAYKMKDDGFFPHG